MKFASKMPVILLYVVAAALVAYSIGLALTSNFNMGNLMVWLLTAMIAAYAIWRKPLHTWFHTPGAGHIVWWCLLVIGVLYAGLVAFVAVSGYANPPQGRKKCLLYWGPVCVGISQAPCFVTVWIRHMIMLWLTRMCLW